MRIGRPMEFRDNSMDNQEIVDTIMNEIKELILK